MTKDKHGPSRQATSPEARELCGHVGGGASSWGRSRGRFLGTWGAPSAPLPPGHLLQDLARLPSCGLESACPPCLKAGGWFLALCVTEPAPAWRCTRSLTPGLLGGEGHLPPKAVAGLPPVPGHRATRWHDASSVPDHSFFDQVRPLGHVSKDFLQEAFSRSTCP